MLHVSLHECASVCSTIYSHVDLPENVANYCL